MASKHKKAPRPRAARTVDDDDRAARRALLLGHARNLFDQLGYDAVHVADVAHAAGLAKGTVFLSFATKEALFLALLEQQLHNWLDELDRKLGALSRPTTQQLASLVARSLSPRLTLTRLLAILSTVLEHNVDEEDIAAFKQRLLLRLGSSGRHLEAQLPFLASGEGARLLLQLDALVIGLRHLADPGRRALTVLQRPHLAPLVVDFDVELERLFAAVLRGLQAERSSP